MPNKRIDQLPPSGNDVKGTDLFPIFSDSKTERISIDTLISFIGSGTTDTYVSGVTYTQSANTLTIGRNDGVDLTTTLPSILSPSGTDVNTDYIVGSIVDGGVTKDLHYVKLYLVASGVVEVQNAPFPFTPSKIVKLNHYWEEQSGLFFGTSSTIAQPSSPWWVSLGKEPGLTLDNDGTQPNWKYTAEVHYVV